MNRPKTHIKKDSFDKIIEFFGFVAILSLIAYTLSIYADLPDKISMRVASENLSNKINIFSLPIISTIMFVGLYFLSKKPELLNYPTEITKENAKYLYKYGAKMLRVLNTVIIILFFLINISITKIHLQENDLLNSLFALFFLFTTLGVVFYYLIKMYKHY